MRRIATTEIKRSPRDLTEDLTGEKEVIKQKKEQARSRPS